ncbi:MAG: hypothetical protein IT350_09155 [Deltaproteobacteria bacterium]|nr:hypothetical protein [Deltaproteobacteria bacterium]
MPERVRPSDRRVFSFALAAIICAKFVLVFLGAGNPQNPLDFLRPVDDAYISYRYAENLAHGFGLEYNPGERVEGGTSIALIALLAPFSLAGIRRIDFVAVVLSLLASAGTVTLASRYLRERTTGLIGRAEAFVLAFLTLSTCVLVWAWAGMETSIFAFVWLAGVLRHLRESEREDWPWASALLTVAAGLLHPDGVLLAPILGLSWLFPFTKTRAVRGVVYGAIVVALFGGYWLARWTYFGYPMPNTFYAKVGSGADLFRAGFTYIRVAVFSTLVPLATAFYALKTIKGWRSWPREVWIFLGAATIYVLYVMKVGGDFYPFHRFFLAALVLLTLAGWRLRGISGKTSGGPASRKAWALVVLAIAAMNVWSYFYTFQGLIHRDLQRVVKNFAATGVAMRDSMPENTTVATLPIGALGFFSKLRIHDMMGLVDLHIARLPRDATRGVVGHEKFDHAYTLSKRPEAIVVLPSLYTDDNAGYEKWLNENALAPSQYRIYEQSALREEYRLAKLPVRKKLVAYGFLRKELVGTPDYDKWTAMSDADNDLAFATPSRAAAHPLHGKSFGIWTFK